MRHLVPLPLPLACRHYLLQPWLGFGRVLQVVVALCCRRRADTPRCHVVARVATVAALRCATLWISWELRSGQGDWSGVAVRQRNDSAMGALCLEHTLLARAYLCPCVMVGIIWPWQQLEIGEEG